MAKAFLYRPNCELCGSDKKNILLSKDFTEPAVWQFLEEYYEKRISKNNLKDGKYEIARCSNCGFIWQTHILNDKLMEKLYNVWISPEQSLNKKRYADITLFSQYAAEVQQISLLLKKKAFEINVLDFGMGWGYWCLMAKAFGYNVAGFEVAKERINFAKRNEIEVIENFAEIANHQFDFINAEQVFEHISQPLQILKSLTQTLKSGGIIRIAVPNGRDIEDKLSKHHWRASKDAVHPLEHINCFTHKTFIQFGKLVGLKPTRQPLLLNYRNNLKSWQKAILLKYYRQYFGTLLYFKKQ